MGSNLSGSDTHPSTEAVEVDLRVRNRHSDREATPSEKSLVYACSGCSNVAQLANDVAVALDRRGVAEMSCIAGVGGGVPKLVKVARSGRHIIAIDGCPLHCVRHCLDKVGVHPDQHFTLTRMGLRKKYREDCNASDLDQLVSMIRTRLTERCQK